MKSIRVHAFGEPDVLKLEDAQDPKAAINQILIRVHAVGVNPVETYIRSGKYGPKDFPFTPGNDAAGVVESVGPGVTKFKPGDRVYTDKTITGSYAELTLCETNRVHALPANVSFPQGAAVGTPAGTAYRGLFQRGRGVAGETVLIHGATGGVGTSAVQLARAAGMTVVATASSDDGRKYARQHGAHHAVDHKITERADEVKSLTGGKGFDLILEMLANVNLASDLTAVATHGRVVVIGSRGKIEIDPRDTMRSEADILGLMLFGASEAEHRQMYAALTAALANGTLRPVIGMELPLAEAPRAHREVIEGDSHGKIVLIP
ncbi:MAG TPA: NADPH:quinone reductase [Tepidisphaeraceae bacterium]|nr:NADPH:quinone reductase [Tepidisphaeraceae bacterium]